MDTKRNNLRYAIRNAEAWKAAHMRDAETASIAGRFDDAEEAFRLATRRMQKLATLRAKLRDHESGLRGIDA